MNQIGARLLSPPVQTTGSVGGGLNPESRAAPAIYPISAASVSRGAEKASGRRIVPSSPMLPPQTPVVVALPSASFRSLISVSAQPMTEISLHFCKNLNLRGQHE